MSVSNACAGGRRGLRAVALAGLLSLLAACQPHSDPLAAFQAKDYARAAELWQPRAEAGDAEAQNYLGGLYQLGLGVRRDYARAVHWYQAAAVQGHADAQRNLGTLYQMGLGVPQDTFNAFVWYYAASLQGQSRAQEYLETITWELTPNRKMQAMVLSKSHLAAAGITWE